MRITTSRLGLLSATLALTACLAPPPDVAVDSNAGLVRAASQDEASELSERLASLSPLVLERLPNSAISDKLEVWLQDQPHLYHSAAEASSEAEGLYAPGHERILLSRNCCDQERVLAHELCHAALGADWQPLTGTLEEGLCDVLASELVPEQSPRLRAGRLSSAALACGGVRLHLEVRDREANGGAKFGWGAAIHLTSEEDTPADPLALFQVQAGLSSTRVKASVKRGYYGLAFLVVERVGIDRLHELCLEASAQGFRKLPRSWVLREAELGEDISEWRKAAAQAMGEAELRELIRMYPASIANALAHHLRSKPGTPEQRWEAVEGSVRLGEGTAELALEDLAFLRAEVLARL